MRYCTWDIETTNLKADIGRILCAVIYDPVIDDFTVFRNDRISKVLADDSTLAVKLRDELETYAMTGGWHIKGFDIPFLNTRLAKARQQPLRRHHVVDGLWSMKGWRGLMPRNGKLATAAEFFDLPERKPSVDVDVWAEAMMGSKEAMDELVDRCKADAKITSQVIDELFKLGVVTNIQKYP